MAVSTPSAPATVRLINASQDSLSFEMRDAAHRLVLVEAAPGEVIEVPGEWCVEPVLPNGKKRMSAIQMMAPQLQPAPAPAAPKAPAAMAVSASVAPSEEDVNAATAAAFERALSAEPKQKK